MFREGQRVIREIGFDTKMYADTGRCKETIFFLGPQLVGGREHYDSATAEEVQEFIEYWENQLEVAKDYIINGCNPHTHEWGDGLCRCGPEEGPGGRIVTYDAKGRKTYRLKQEEVDFSQLRAGLFELPRRLESSLAECCQS